jgi:hypothetical protein
LLDDNQAGYNGSHVGCLEQKIVNFEVLNSAFITLIPKKIGADHFRPISLVHSFAKLVTKVLANRLA